MERRAGGDQEGGVAQEAKINNEKISVLRSVGVGKGNIKSKQSGV